MDALAAIARAEGDTETALKLRQKARAVYEARLIAFPEAAAGHALEHYLQDKADANTALALAQKNYQTRPYGEAAMALAKAWMRDSKPARASALIEMHLGNGWDTAEAYWLLGVALETQKFSQRAGAAKAAALQRNPASERMYGFVP